MFHIRKQKKEKNPDEFKEKPVVYYGVKYVGGRILYPEWFDANIVLWSHQLEVRDDYQKDAIILQKLINSSLLFDFFIENGLTKRKSLLKHEWRIGELFELC